MAPPGRAKQGLRRIDAAYSRLVPMGFSKKVISKAIRNIRKVYGEGDDGWFFLEDGNYQMVIDKLLGEQQEEVEEKEDNMQLNGGGEDNSKALATTGTVLDPGKTSVGLDLISDGFQSGRHALTSGEAGGREDGSSGALPSPDIQPVAVGGASTIRSPRPPTALELTEFLQSRSQQPPTEVTGRKRPPCHGWISESESEEEE